MSTFQIEAVSHATCELDSHADTCVAGPNCRVLEYTNDTVNVNGFSRAQGTLTDIPIVKAATAYDDPTDGTTYILILNQAVFLGDLTDVTLLCPNQLRYNAVHVDDCPVHLSPIDQPSTHSLFFPDDQISLPLLLKGPISYFQSRTPTNEELERCKWMS
jgi:hypothetical protein